VSARSFDFAAVRRISVTGIGDGSIVVEPGPSGDVVEGTISCADPATLDAVVVRQDHDQLRIDLPRSYGEAVHLRIGAPAGLDYDIAAGAADVSLRVDAGWTRIRSGSGDVSLGRARDLSCTSGSGDISVAEAYGDSARLTTGSGDVRIQLANCAVTAKSGSGELMIRELRQAGLQASSGSGAVSVASTTGSVDLRSASGALTIGVANGLRAWLDLRSVSGELRIALDASDQPEPGEPYVSVRARTASGEIAVYRA
jgi:hypothetical protein